jgi:hypothetical protein
MDVFALRNHLISDYAAYIESFVSISDEHIQAHVDHELREGLLWPDPLLQLNPCFEPGLWIDDLVANETLHPLCRRIFRIKPTGAPEKPLRLHKHQTDAIYDVRPHLPPDVLGIYVLLPVMSGGILLMEED